MSRFHFFRELGKYISTTPTYLPRSETLLKHTALCIFTGRNKLQALLQKIGLKVCFRRPRLTYKSGLIFFNSGLFVNQIFNYSIKESRQKYIFLDQENIRTYIEKKYVSLNF
jgi:hypothetical protein